MRYNLEQYPELLSLDARKTRTTVEGWPYFAPCVLTGDGKAGTIIEGFILSERKDSYNWLIKEAFAMAPSADVQRVRVVFSDGCLDEGDLLTFGLPNATWFLDAWHCVVQDLPDIVGKRLWPLVKDSFDELVWHCTTEERHLELLQAIRSALKFDPQVLESVEREYLCRVHCFGNFFRSKAEWTCGKRGSQLSESIHSSTHARVDTGGPLACIFEVIPRHLRRHSDMAKDLALQLSQENQGAILYTDSDAVKVRAKRIMTTFLFDTLYEPEYKASFQYTAQETSPDRFQVLRDKQADGGLGREVVVLPDRAYGCSCQEFTGFQAFCRHSIAVDRARGFDGLHHFPSRWKRLTVLGRSRRAPDFVNAVEASAPSEGISLAAHSPANDKLASQALTADAADTTESQGDVVVGLDIDFVEDDQELASDVTTQTRYSYAEIIAVAKRVCSAASSSAENSRKVMALMLQTESLLSTGHGLVDSSTGLAGGVDDVLLASVDQFRIRPTVPPGSTSNRRLKRTSEAITRAASAKRKASRACSFCHGSAGPIGHRVTTCPLKTQFGEALSAVCWRTLVESQPALPPSEEELHKTRHISLSKSWRVIVVHRLLSAQRRADGTSMSSSLFVDASIYSEGFVLKEEHAFLAGNLIDEFSTRTKNKKCFLFYVG
eukprot:scaffold2330_cov404-Pinguiococcus_pyrenoidosus.AAC.1